jgi:hypothetical protein
MANFFPRWSNFTPLKLVICLGAIGFGVTFVFAVYSGPKSQRVGYQPTQPIPYSHEIHVDQLGMDCRYCHSFVEHGAHANVPSANVCWNCHGPNKVKSESPKLQPLRDAMAQNEEGENIGEPIEWVRIHKAPDYVYFNHSAHVNRGVSCQNCHGNINKMEVVHHDKPLTMGWCLDCHRNPEQALRPLEEVTNLDYSAEEYLKKHKFFETKEDGSQGDRILAQEEFGAFLKAHWNVKPKESCSTCHR